MEALCDQRNAVSRLAIKMANFEIFRPNADGWDTVSGADWEIKVPKATRYDLLLGNFPLGMQREEFDHNGEPVKHRKNWIELLKSLSYLNDEGMAIFLVEPSAFGLAEGKKFVSLLNKYGWYVRAIFNAPENFLHPVTVLRPVFVCLVKDKNQSIFLGEIRDPTQVKGLILNFSSGDIGSTLLTGMEVEPSTFHSFARTEAELQLQRLEGQYKQYERFPLEKISESINTVPKGEHFEETENCIYLQKIGAFHVFSNLAEVGSKDHNYYQVVLKPSVSNTYLREFFSSEMGSLVLQSIGRGAALRSIRLDDLKELPVAIPSPEAQKTITDTAFKLKELSAEIANLGSELALNPMGAGELLKLIESTLEVIGALSEADKILALCRQGESKIIEFKESLSLDVRKGTKEKHIEQSALKTIVAFLNSDGGNLLIGVKDSGEITGTEGEITKFHNESTDKFLLHFKNLLCTRVGEQFYPFIEHDVFHVSGKNVLKVSCTSSKTPCYLDGSAFYVRTNPATDKLEGPKLVEYVKNHFV